jgi:hypothetical protein
MNLTTKYLMGGALAGTVGRFLVNAKWSRREALIHVGLYVATVALAIVTVHLWTALQDAPAEVIGGVGATTAFIAPRLVQLAMVFSVKFSGGGLQVDGDGKD